MKNTSFIKLLKNYFFLISFIAVTTFSSATAQNPIIRGFADPAMKVHNGKMYMVVGKDSSPYAKRFEMPYWAVLSSTDLREWAVEAYIHPKDTYMGAGSIRCWAADISFKNNKVYFYFSNGGQETGLLVADSPKGPYVDIYNKPFLPKEMTTNAEYDPITFTDDDGKNYLIYGRNGMLNGKIEYYSLIELEEDMVTLKGEPIPLKTDTKFGFGSDKRAKDHAYFHKYLDTYYLSCGGLYRTSKTLTGTYSNVKSTGQLQGHASFEDYNGQSYHAWEFTCDPYDNRRYRQSMITYLHYKDNGDMVSDPNFLQSGKYFSTGVGSYDANWPVIEAEWFFKKSEQIQKREGANGFVLKNIQNNSYVNFPYLFNMSDKTTIYFHIASKVDGGKIEIRTDGVHGKLIGTCNIPNTNNLTTFTEVAATLTKNTNTNNIYFVFKGKSGEIANLNAFSFTKDSF